MLEIRGLEKAFGSHAAVSDIHLTIPKGEFFSLLGPSGCGKTTLLRMLGGFEMPTAGEIRQNGARIDLLPPNQRHFNMVFQRYALFPHLNVRENIAFGLRMKKVAAAEICSRVDEMLSLVKLGGMEERKISTLSGGQQQRVALARALVNRPKVLLLDEPLSALDLKLRQQMQVELKAIQRRLGHTFIFVTHDQEEALTLSDRVAVMNEGKIEQVGTPEEMYNEPKSAFVARFIGSINQFEGVLMEWSRARAVVKSGGTSFEVFSPQGRELSSIASGKNAKVRLLIRPERIQFVSDSEPATRSTNRIRGVLKEILYQGPMTQYFVECGELAGSLLMVSVPSIRKASFGPGDTVQLSLDPESFILMESC